MKEREILEKNGFKVDILHPPKGKGILSRNLYLKREMEKFIVMYDYFVIYDMLTLLFLINDIKTATKKKIIYEIIDIFPYYYSYKITKNSIISYPVKQLLVKIEDLIVRRYVSKAIVNSWFLYKRFKKIKKEVSYIPYTSPFEKKEFNNNPNLPPAFIYIGQFSLEKGAEQIIKLALEFNNFPIFVIGDYCYKLNKDSLPQNVRFYPRTSTKNLFNLLFDFSQKHFLYGLSLITGKNKSFFYQEANKDIDYLSLGIPIIGNERPPTYEKIKLGGGLLYTDLSPQILFNKSLKRKLKEKALEIYEKYYSNYIFEKKLLSIFKNDQD
ncbi:hypothetical protein [Balnearium lithotrophicum]|uniref:hypothetical protein n=1 Tax=Balnearium lithotrophicum TaxID=223788 RepID=UPI00163D4E48|nr:hypothetical protein [Balnearium lithotrophicum]